MMSQLRQVRGEIRGNKLPQRTDFVIETIIKRSVQILRAKGHEAEADLVWREYQDNFKGFVTLEVMKCDLGDFAPLNDYLAGVLEILRFTLGEFLMDQFHLSDIRILNYAIPVVFHPCNSDWSNKKEYRLHFVPFSGVVTYWSVWLGCTIAGGLPIPLACSAAGTLGKQLMIFVFAPGLSNFIFTQACGKSFMFDGTVGDDYSVEDNAGNYDSVVDHHSSGSE